MTEEWRLDATGVTHPLLFECDREGRVVWMSRQARAVVGDGPLHAAMAEYLRGGASFRVWAAFVMPETLLFAAQAEGPQAAGSDGLGQNLLGRYFRLEKPSGNWRILYAGRVAAAGRRLSTRSSVNAGDWGAICILAWARCWRRFAYNWR